MQFVLKNEYEWYQITSASTTPVGLKYIESSNMLMNFDEDK